jgi:hypothetical protein
MPDRERRQEPSTALFLVRYVMPTVIVLGGILVIILSPTISGLEGAAGIIGAGLSIALLNVLHRMGVDGDVARDEEAAARRYFDEHGHWPDEAAERHGAAAR